MAAIAFITVADQVEMVNGNVNALGLGWNWCHTPVPAHDVIVRVLVAPSVLDDGGPAHSLTLVDADGRSVDVAGGTEIAFAAFAGGTTPNGMDGTVEVPIWLHYKVSGLVLRPGRYQWRIDVEAEVDAYPFAAFPPEG